MASSSSQGLIWFKYIADTQSFTGGISLLNGWWDAINESQKWQEDAFYALCVAYALVCLIALVQLVRIQMRVPEYGWTTQKVFHLMNFVVNGLRAVQFGFYWRVFHRKPKVSSSTLLGMVLILQLLYSCWKVLDMILLDLPGLLFFSTYTLLVLFWAEIYHQARSLPTDKLRPTYFIINGIVYFIQICIWMYMEFSKSDVAVEVAELFFSVISLGAAVGFILYGGRLFVMLRRFPIESRGRQKKMHEVGFVTGICCTCFLIRCIMVAVAAFDKNADIHVLNHPILDFVYYMIVEILPSALVLFILRKLPPRRASDQYHPIK